jgi:hypothetical protein
MEFDEHATPLVARREPASPLTVTYLGRKERAEIGNSQTITAHPVVEIDDSATGERIFYVDTTRHWPRAIVLGADALACLFTFVLCLMHVESRRPAKEDGVSSESADIVPSATI